MSQSTSSTGTMVTHPMTVHWSDDVEEILDGDHALMLAYATPANGVVLLPGEQLRRAGPRGG